MGNILSSAKVALAALAILLLSACERTPDNAQLSRDIATSLAATFGDTTFEVLQVARRGTAIDSTAPRGETRRVVYFDISLRLKRDLELGAWDQPGAAALVSLFGAGPRSIRGIKSSGNREGDLITAHASAIYRQTDDGWLFVTPVGFSAPDAPVLDLAAQSSGMERLRATLEEMTRSLPYKDSNLASTVVNEELEHSLTRIQARLARLQNGYTLASGPEKGEYLAFAQALAAIAPERQGRVLPLTTGGGADNIALLRSGDAVIGLAQADVAAMAYRGAGPFAADGPFATLRALGSLYPELIHVIVRQDSGLERIHDLQGKRISLGAEGSGGSATLRDVLAAHGLTAGQDYEAVTLPLTSALQQLNAGDLDAVVQVIGVPSNALRIALAQANLTLLPLEADAIATLSQTNPALMALAIPKGTYPGQTAPVATLGTSALLLGTTALTDDEAAAIVRTVFQANQDIMAAGSVQGAQLSAHTARQGLTIPLHAGALEALQTLAPPTDRPTPHGDRHG